MASDEVDIEIPFPHRQLFVDDINTDGLARIFNKPAQQSDMGSP